MPIYLKMSGYVGYKNNLKDLHYYRCLKCNGVSVNARTTKRAKRKGANELFLDLLDKYKVPDEIIPLIKMQLTKMFNHFNERNIVNEGRLKGNLESLERKLKDLKIRYGLGDIDRETYDLTFNHLSDQMRNVTKEINTFNPTISNLEKLLSSAIKKLSKLSQLGALSNLDTKRRIQKTLFPDGIL